MLLCQWLLEKYFIIIYYKMPANVATNYADSKKRAIRLSDKGTYYVKTSGGKRSYGPKASFRKTSEGSMRKLRVGSAVPAKIKRATRANKGVTRGPQASSYKKALTGGRKPRSNKGVTRGPQEGVVQRRMNAAAKRVAVKRVAGPRKPRANKGVARGPREGAVQRMMNTESKRMRARGQATRKTVKKLATFKTPTEAELYQMIFGTPPKRKVRANKGVKRVAKKPAAKKSPAKKASPLGMMLRPRSVKK